MKKLKINESIFNFLKNNKIKLSALSLTAILITTCAVIDYQRKVNKNTSIDKYNQMFSNIEQCLKNDSSNIEVIKNENGIYTITKYNYKEMPIFDKNENGENIITGYKKELVKSIQYSLSTEQAENLGLTNLLEEKTNNKVKTK